MNIKSNKGLAGTDIVIAIIAIMIFSTLILSMISSNLLESIKLKNETLAMIYITEILENVGIEEYNNLPVGTYKNIISNTYDDYIEGLIPQDFPQQYEVDMVITDKLENVTNNEDILKKVQITLTYKVGNKFYMCSMERMKVKE